MEGGFVHGVVAQDSRSGFVVLDDLDEDLVMERVGPAHVSDASDGALGTHSKVTEREPCDETGPVPAGVTGYEDSLAGREALEDFDGCDLCEPYFGWGWPLRVAEACMDHDGVLGELGLDVLGAEDDDLEGTLLVAFRRFGPLREPLVNDPVPVMVVMAR
jgi:hypothetical protein